MSLSDHELDIYLDEIDFCAAEKPLDFVEIDNFEVIYAFNDGKVFSLMLNLPLSKSGREPIINTGILPEKDIEQWLQKVNLPYNGFYIPH